METLEPAGLLDPHELLSTKLALPRLRSPLVPRPHLLARLDAGLERKLGLVSAPAGFGKTTLAADWVHQLKGEGRRAGWVSLDAGDNDPVRFWRYVLTACGAFGEGVGSAALAILHVSQQPPFEALLTHLINELARLPARGVLILEDYHLVASPQLHDAVAFLLEHLPQTLHLVILTRTDPPLPLGRLRARDELGELRAADLRFSTGEMEAFLRQAIPAPLSPEAVRRLAERTEGWPAGLRLAALALQGRQEPQEVEQFLDTFTGTHRPVLEYLAAEVLAAQPAPLQEFLLQTAFLSRLSASLCDAVTGRDDSGDVLRQLERGNLFLSPLDAAGEWYRYHALFAQAMQRAAQDRLGEAAVRGLFHKASRWYAEHGLLAEAVEAALDARDYPRAANLVEQVIAPRLVQNEHHTLRRWLEQIPEEVLYRRPRLCFMYAISVLFTSDRRAPATHALLAEPLKVAEQAWREQGDRHKLGELMAFRSVATWVQGNVPRSLVEARQALELLPEDDVQWRGISLIFAGVEEQIGGKLNAARQTLNEARALNIAARNAYGTLDTTLILAEVYAGQAELQQAVELYRWVLREAETTPMDTNQALLRRGRALNGLARLALEWNDLDGAGRDASEALATGERIGDEDLQRQAALTLARVKQAGGDARGAQEMLHALIARTKEPLLIREVENWQAQLALAAGDLATAQRWVDGRADPGDDLPAIQRELEELTLARLSIARGETGEVLPSLEGWLEDAHAQGRARSELEILTLQALGCSALGDAPQSRRLLIRALELAQPEGFRRLFLDGGEEVRLLILDSRSMVERNGPERLLVYMEDLLNAFAQEPSEGQQRTITNRKSEIVNLLDPLSQQEERVLRLLVAGLSNPEIARELVVSVNTVKTHVKSIFRKLDVSSRKEVREAARRLNLL